jgi:hypothetical protein
VVYLIFAMYFIGVVYFIFAMQFIGAVYFIGAGHRRGDLEHRGVRLGMVRSSICRCAHGHRARCPDPLPARVPWRPA